MKMIQKVDLEDNRNLFVVATILITGIGGMTLTFGKVTLTEEGKILAEIPLAVKVRGFSLPDRPALTTVLFTRPGFSVKN